MNEKRDKAREEAWKNLGITMFRPPTPKELKDVFDYAFNNGWMYGVRDQREMYSKMIEELKKIQAFLKSDGENKL
jgi:hypothetical protein